MFEIIRIYPNVVILDINNDIDLDYLNLKIHETLIKRKDLNPEDTRTKRATRKDKYIIIHAHGSLMSHDLTDFIINLFELEKIKFIVRSNSKEEYSYLEDSLPKFSFLNRQYQGAPVLIKDSNTIDPGVAPICEAINLIPGIETFASCDGHSGARSFYFLYTAKTMLSQEIATFYLTQVVDKYFSSFDINNSDNNKLSMSLKVSYMPDGVPTGMYFHFEISYHKSMTEVVMNFSKFAKEEIIKQIENKNFGNLGSDNFYHFTNF